LEGQLAAASEERSRAIAEVEQTMTAERVKQQVLTYFVSSYTICYSHNCQLHYEETLDQLRQSLSLSEDTIAVQQQRIEQMEKDLPESTSRPRNIRSPRTKKQTITPG